MGKFSFGQSVRRIEDHRFLTGHGRFLDDLSLPHQLCGAVLRSPHAHARIVSLDRRDAATMPGVAAILTGEDLAQAGLGTLPCLAPLPNRDGSPMATPPRPALAVGRVRHVGEAVAFVVAETLAQARDAAEAITVEYEPLPAVVDTAAALAPDAPQIWEAAPRNVALDWEMGNAAAVEAAFRKAAHVTRLRLINNRVIVNSMEPRGALAVYDAGQDRYTLHASTQGPHSLRNSLADRVLKVPRDRLRVVTPDVGGGFGMKGFDYPEYAMACWAARVTGRPVKWTAERGEAFVTDTQGRDHVTEAELALDRDGRFLALRVSTIGNLGAYLSDYAPFIPTVAGSGMLAGLYTTPAIHVAARCVFTNTVPVDAYRGAGRPEAAYVVERMADAAARDLGLSPDEIRRRNFIAPEKMPFKTAMGEVYDSGEFARNMDDAMKLAGWSGIEARRREARTTGRLRGIGMSNYVESCGGGFEEMAEIRLEQDGAVTLVIGSQNNGQGHETTYAQLIADGLGVPIERVRVVQGDTDQIAFGNGTGGSRMLVVGGNAVRGATERVVRTAKRVAAIQMEAAEADIEFAGGVFRVAGTDRKMSLKEIARAAYNPRRQKEGMEFGLAERWTYLPPAMTYPNGCHVAEVEIDPETGRVAIMNYTVVDDFGRVFNPMMLDGQIHGGTAQGIGQALYEHCVYDPESGQLLTGSLMDYHVPRAGDLPSFRTATNEVPCRTNPLGVKGAGEAGAIGAPPAVINAIVDALAEFGVRHIDMPATPERVWRALQGGEVA